MRHLFAALPLCLRAACGAGFVLALSGCYYYGPYGYPPYYGAVPVAATQQETAMPSAPPPADAQYPGPLVPTPPVYPVYPAVYPAWGGYGWGWPAVSFGWSGGY